MSEFLAMGGHAAFVWPAWGLTVATLAALTIAAWRARARAAAALAAAGEDDAPRGEAGPSR